jgi:L-fuconolactonase
MTPDRSGKTPVIDAHHHFWTVERGDYHWMTPDEPALYQDYGPQDLEPHLRHHGIDATIMVQAAQTVEETRYLLDLADRSPFVAGVVGWVDFTASMAAGDIARLAEHPLLVGLRPMVQDIEDDDWLLRRDLAPAMAAMVDRGLVFDALTLPRHLPRLAAFLDRYPDLPVVVDHGSKPFIRQAILDPWRADMTAIAARPHTFCKISGLVTEASPHWTVADVKPYVDHIVEVFGPERLMWGSDWPVVNVARGYRDWRNAAEETLSGFGDHERAMIFGGNAERFYLGSRGRPVR